MPEKTFTGSRKGITISSGRTPAARPCVNPTRTSSSYFLLRLQVSKVGATVLGRGALSQIRLGIFHSMASLSVGVPRGMFMFAWDMIVHDVSSVRFRSWARMWVNAMSSIWSIER